MSTLQFRDARVTPDIVHKYSADTSTPIIIDNGSYACRVGWSTDLVPRLIFRNQLAKPRRDRNKKDGDVPAPVTQIGNDILNIEALRFQLRTQFDRNVVTHYSVQEQIYDYTFRHLGINTEEQVNHPIVLTEALLNPNYSRNLMSELLFECYDVPSVCYGVDSLFSYYKNMSGLNDDGLIVSCGYQATHIIPVLGGNMVVEKARRLNLGGSHMINFMHRLLQLKYPVHVNSLTISRSEELLHEHCRIISCDYMDQLRSWADLSYYESHVKKFQLPFNQTVSSVPTLTAEQKMEKKRDLAKRLSEVNARRREEKLAEDEVQLNQLLNIRELYDDDEEFNDDFEEALRANQIEDLEELEKWIATLSSKIEKTRQKMTLQMELANAPNIPLPPVPAEEKIPQPPQGVEVHEWICDVKLKRSNLVERRTARKQRRKDLAKRHTAAAQERMRIISQLAKKDKGVDDFGMRDEDWDVYKTISKDGDSDSDVENEKLLSYEMILRHHDPSFEEPTAQIPGGGIAEYHQIHVGVELHRVPELLFQPSMIGSIEAGLVETIEYVLKMFTAEEQMRLVNNVFLTGSCCKLPGLKERLERELTEIRPFRSTHKVTVAADASLDAWIGAQRFTRDHAAEDIFISRTHYQEYGGESALKVHAASNKYFETPSPILTMNEGIVE